MGNSLFGLLRFLFVQRIKGFETPIAPMLDGETLDRLKQELSYASRYLEFGSGGSTIMADRMGVTGISVEGDRYYAAAVRKGLQSGTMTVLTPDIGFTGPWGWPLLKRHSRKRTARWRRYIEAPFDQVAQFPNVILVDGRFRVACALESARQAYERRFRATLIVDDYHERYPYRQIEEYLGPPVHVGRAAIFEIGSRPVSKSVVDSAMLDPS